MTDPYPQEFEIPIERDKLYMYWRYQWILSFATICGLLGTAIGMTSTLPSPRFPLPSNLTPIEIILRVCMGIGTGAIVGGGIGAILYFLFCDRWTRKSAEEYKVAVQGQFLRVTKGARLITDRKLHFRAIVDFMYVQGPYMRRFGIHGIRMTTTAGGQHSAVEIHAVQDAMKVRDQLCEIDRIREDQVPA